MKAESGDTSTDSAGANNFGDNSTLQAALAQLDIFQQGISSTWKDLLESGRPKDINKKLRPEQPAHSDGGDMPEDDNEAADKYTGSTAIMILDENDREMTAWDRMQKRLSEAPVIQDILGRTHELYEKSGAKDAQKRMGEIKEDANEAWETSQNPWVYRLSSVYDTITAESEYAIAVRELRKLDPDFTLESWKTDVVEHTLPKIMDMFLQGRIKELKPWLGEAVYNRLAAEIRERKKEGVQIDTNVLGIMNSEILACEVDHVNKGSPIILLHYMCQQINCVRKKEDESIVEGSEDDIRANSYVLAFQREYDEEKMELNWKIIDFRFNGAIAYL
eukprot:CAMPEP_0198291482 /NCGR_PEP_ID=MMETSP1449-20131203/8998_1 /TAXON_ID=420275 /ORGANISM="Attheya septentrionalis, Strain CCMP2084" /LENGTH=332 /DNA_ID=CAMNT_0043990129 /DNA_START=143 /DNA_END=1141 /DNA_ORIENTATION=-